MKIIEAISDMNIGGAGRLLLTRLSNSDRGDFEYVVILPEESRLCPKFSDIGIRVRTVNGGKDKSLDIRTVTQIIRIIREEGADTINCHGCLSARIAAFLCAVPVKIYTRHCAYPIPVWKKIFPIKQIIGGVNMLLSDRVIAVAGAAERDLIDMGVKKDRIRVIINGVDGVRKYDPHEREKVREELGLCGKFVVGICARVERCKDHESFLRAARLLALEDEKYRFLIVGEGKLLDDMKELAAVLGIEEKVIFTGFTDDVERYYNTFDLNVNCSVGTETSSLALSEGMSIGLPSVASSYGGNPYMVRHGENGFIYTQKDFVELAEMIRRIASSKELYSRMSKKAYERYICELNSQKMTRETETLYAELYNSYMIGGKGEKRAEE